MSLIKAVSNSFSVKTRSKFYTAGRLSFSSNSYFIRHSTDAKVWTDVNLNGMDFESILSFTEVNDILVLSVALNDGTGALILSDDDFDTWERYATPYRFEKMEFAGQNYALGLARTTPNTSVLAAIRIEVSSVDTAPAIEINLPDVYVYDNTEENSLFVVNGEFVFYGSSGVMKSDDGKSWTPWATLTDVEWFTYFAGYFYFRKIPDGGGITTVFRTNDFVTITELTEFTDNTYNIRMVNQGIQDFDALYLWDINSAKEFKISPSGVVTSISTTGISVGSYPSGFMYNSSNGRYVQFGYYEQYYSTNGIAWTRNTDANWLPRSTYVFKNLFIAAVQSGNDTVLRYSSDGVVWNTPTGIDTTSYGNAYSTFSFVEQTNGTLIFYIIRGDTETFWSTTDGMVWKQEQSPLTDNQYRLKMAATGNTLNAFISNNNKSILQTKTALSNPTWTGMSLDSIDSSEYYQAMGSDGNGIVYFIYNPFNGIATDTPLFRTEDAGNTYITFNSPIERRRLSSSTFIKIGDYTYVTGTEHNDNGETLMGLYRTQDYIQWDKIEINSPTLAYSTIEASGVNYDGYKWVIAGYLSQFYQNTLVIYSSTDNMATWSLKSLHSDDTAIDWQEVPMNTEFAMMDVKQVSSNKTILASANVFSTNARQPMYSSPDGTVWSLMNDGEFDLRYMRDIQSKGAHFTILYGTFGQYEYIFSKNGADWFKMATPIDLQGRVTENYPVHTTDDYVLATWSDGMNDETTGQFIIRNTITQYDWSGQPLQSSVFFNDTNPLNGSSDYIGVFGGKTFVLYDSRRVFSSTDLQNWDMFEFNNDDYNAYMRANNDGTSVAMNSNRVVIGGDSNKVYSSSDLVTWTPHVFTPVDSDLENNEWNVQSVTYSTLTDMFYVAAARFDYSLNAYMFELYSSSDLQTWYPVDLPIDAPALSMALQPMGRFLSTEEADVLFMYTLDPNTSDESVSYVWSYDAGEWVTVDYGDAPTGWFAGGGQSNVPNFTTILTDVPTQNTALFCANASQQT